MREESEKWVPVGRLGRPVGRDGGIRVGMFNPASDLLCSLSLVALGEKQSLVEKEIDRLAHRGNGSVIWFSDVTSREAAKDLTGQEILVPRSKLPSLSDGEYYWCDLIGLSVETSQGDQLGSLAEMLETGSNDILVVTDGTREILLPMIPDVLKEVNFAQGKIVVNPPEEIDAL